MFREIVWAKPNRDFYGNTKRYSILRLRLTLLLGFFSSKKSCKRREGWEEIENELKRLYRDKIR